MTFVNVVIVYCICDTLNLGLIQIIRLNSLLNKVLKIYLKRLSRLAFHLFSDLENLVGFHETIKGDNNKEFMLWLDEGSGTKYTNHPGKKKRFFWGILVSLLTSHSLALYILHFWTEWIFRRNFQLNFQNISSQFQTMWKYLIIKIVRQWTFSRKFLGTVSSPQHRWVNCKEYKVYFLLKPSLHLIFLTTRQNHTKKLYYPLPHSPKFVILFSQKISSNKNSTTRFTSNQLKFLLKKRTTKKADLALKKIHKYL